jgi:hypothetical protein
MITESQYLSALKSGHVMGFEVLIRLIEQTYHYTPVAFTNGDIKNSKDENQGSAKVFCFANIHKLTQLETLYCFGEHYQAVLNNPESDTHQNIRHFMTYGWLGLNFSSSALSLK